MRVRDAVAAGQRALSDAGIASARHDAEALVAHLLSMPRTRLDRSLDLTAEQLAAYRQLVTRRCQREPLQHITGLAAFRHLELVVGPGVFIPRPETEVLAGWAIDRLHELERPVAVDLCSGSGAVALALATEVPGSQLYAVELSSQAYSYAARNLAGSGVDLRLGDMADALPELDGAVDVVVANPPYIPLDAYESVDREAREFDPPMSLWSGSDGLEVVRVVAQVATRLLRPGGWVGCEHADVQGSSAPGVFAASGNWIDVRDHPDLAGRPRFVTARRR